MVYLLYGVISLQDARSYDITFLDIKQMMMMMMMMMMMICFQTSDRDKLLSEFSQFVKVTVNEEEQAVHKLLGKQFQVIVMGPDKDSLCT